MTTKLAILATILVATSAMQAASTERQSLGELVCSLDDQGTSSSLSVAPGVEVGAVAQKVRCIFRNRQTGTSDEYTGTAQFLKNAAQSRPLQTLLWDVTVLPSTRVTPAILDQSFALEADVAQKAYVRVAGQEQSGVKLSMQKPQADSAMARSLLGLKLQLALSVV